MYPLFETICVKDGAMQHIQWHQLRYEQSYLAYYDQTPTFKLIDVHIPDSCKTGLYKMRLSYNKTSTKIEYEKYHIKKITSLKLIEAGTLTYKLKYTDRSCIDDLYRKKENCDDILIVINGMVSDSSYSNIVFFNGHEWITPATPLLKGTSRERLLNSGMIKEQAIGVHDIKNFHSFKLINAMRDFETIEAVAITHIHR